MPAVVMLTSDLIFAAKVTAAARAGGLECRTAKTERTLREALASEDVSLIVADLELDPAVLDACARLLAESIVSAKIAYYPHVRNDLRERAASLGCHEIMVRSRFVADLDAIIGRYSAP